MKLEELVNKHYKQLNENDLYILKYIMNNRDSVHDLGINSLANKCNVSRSSVLRLAQKLDFSGYSEFRVFLKWEHETDTDDKDSVELLKMDISHTLKYAESKDFTELCALLDRADRIFIFGTGSAQLSVANELQRMFISVEKYMYVIKAVRELEMVKHSLTENDLVIFISFSGDTPSIFPVVQTLVAKGVAFISITNLKNNRLAHMTPYNLYANSTGFSHNREIVETFASFFIIVEMLYRNYIAYQMKNE